MVAYGPRKFALRADPRIPPFDFFIPICERSTRPKYFIYLTATVLSLNG